MSYSQLTYEQRYLIYGLLKIGHTQTYIAKMIGVHRSTISRELKRNTGKRGYRYEQAQRMAERRKNKARKRITAEDWLIIERYLRKDFSPEQTAYWVLKKIGIQVSPEWIYQHIWEDKSMADNCTTISGGRKSIANEVQTAISEAKYPVRDP
jgi:transposase, IS30 family